MKSSISCIPSPIDSGAKDRPAVIISCLRYNREKLEVILLPITGQLRHADTYGTVIIDDWQRAGLTKPSVIKPMPHTPLQSAVRRKVGELAKADKDRLREMLSEVISSDF